MADRVDANEVDANEVDANEVDANEVDANKVESRRARRIRVSPVNQPLFIRYPGREWMLFDETNVTALHQKKGLELFIESGEDTLDVSIPHAIGGLFMATFNKTISRGEEDIEFVLYSYTRVDSNVVQMMYADPSYIAYINRLTRT